MKEAKYDVCVIGAGIAGLSAALYSSRLGLNAIIISMDLGGQLSGASVIENYPGFLKIKGSDLIRRVEAQVRKLGVDIFFDEVTGISRVNDSFEVTTAMGLNIKCDAVIVACGKAPRRLNVPGEEKLRGRGVSYCAVCDGPLFRGRKVLLVGVGEKSREAVNLLSKYASKLIWVFPGKSPGVAEDFLAEVTASANIEVRPNTAVKEIKGNMKVESVVLKNLASGEEEEIAVDGVFVEMGYTLKTDFLRNLVKLNEKGEIIVDRLCRTSCEGIFAAGDVTDLPYKQAIIAAAQGAIAALSAYNYLAEKKGLRKVKADWKHT